MSGQKATLPLAPVKGMASQLAALVQAGYGVSAGGGLGGLAAWAGEVVAQPPAVSALPARMRAR